VVIVGPPCPKRPSYDLAWFNVGGGAVVRGQTMEQAMAIYRLLDGCAVYIRAAAGGRRLGLYWWMGAWSGGLRVAVVPVSGGG